MVFLAHVAAAGSGAVTATAVAAAIVNAPCKEVTVK